MSGHNVLLASEDMDWNSQISTGCSSTTAAIVNTSPALRLFIREVREARAELDAVLAELHSLGGVVDLLREDAASFPLDLARRTPPLLDHCTSIVDQIAGYLHVCNGRNLSKRDKKFRWLAIRADMVKLSKTLEGYKSILAVVTDLVGLNKTRMENNALSEHSSSSGHQHAAEDQTATNEDIRTELTHVMADMGTLRGRLQGDFRSNYAVADLESYLDAMQLDATNLGYRMNAGYRMTGTSSAPLESPVIPGKSADRENRVASSGTTSSVGDDLPDSAIDINDGPPSPCQSSLPPIVSSCPIVEIDEFLDELCEPMRPPTPPPKASTRLFSTGDLPSTQNTVRLAAAAAAAAYPMPRPASTYSMSVYSTMLDPESPVIPQYTNSIHNVADSDGEGDARSTLGSLKGIRPPHSNFDYNYRSTDRQHIGLAVSGLPPSASEFDSLEKGPKRPFGRNKSFSVSTQPTRPIKSSEGFASHPSSHSRSLSLLPGGPYGPNSATFMTPSMTAPSHPPIPGAAPATPRPGHGRAVSVDTAHTDATTSSGGKAPRKSAGSIRSNSSHMSSALSRVSFWRRHRTKHDGPAAEDPEPDDIFGVSLKKSMQMASAAVRTHHDGSKSSSRREFPRCILACVTFIREHEGITTPHLFGGGGGGDFGVSMGGDAARMAKVAALKEAFSTGPHYGEAGTVDWARFDAHDAAELVVLFLQQLPRPLVSETVAKRWVTLSRQATLPGSMGLRLDSCIDFWDEALLGVRGPARSLFKLLLNLWGDVADAAEVNDMTAERLAARLLNPLMHLPAGKYTTDYMLGLAFLIRKRSEYAIMLRDGRRSNAAF